MLIPAPTFCELDVTPLKTIKQPLSHGGSIVYFGNSQPHQKFLYFSKVKV